MLQAFRGGTAFAQFVLQRLAFVLFAGTAVLVAGYSLACAAGLAPWLSLELRFGDILLPQGGIIVQLALALLALLLCAFLPSNARVMALETSHRNFQIGMRDVTRAYRAAHKADREGVFTLSSEFDSVRERMAFLRDHPDLGALEPSVIEIASQMSHISRELAETYSDRKVARARDFLIQRQQEIETFNDQLEQAKAIATEMRSWLARVEIEEDIARSQLNRLWEELDAVLPDLDTSPAATQGKGGRPVNTVALDRRRAAE